MKKTQKKTVGTVLMNILRDLIPVVQDSPREWVRKLAFLMAFIVFVGAGWYLIDDVWVQPHQTEAVIDTLRDWYYSPDDDTTVLPEQGGTPVQFPVGMMPKYQSLYRANSEIRGWIQFVAGEGDNDLFEGCIDNPIVQTSDNDYYLNHDFWGRQDKAGTLYFDYRNDLSDGGVNRNLILYGHNLKSGLMFSRFNLLVSGKVERAQKLTTLLLNTLYEERAYKVFAVMVLDAEEEGTVGAFSALRTQFSGEADFLRYVEQIRARSLYHFGDVDVAEGDEILTMLTCSNKKDTTLKEGRTIIVARRVRDGEEATVDPSKTTLNENALMPRQWYVNKNLPLPDVYTAVETTPSTVLTVQSSTTTTTVPSEEGTTTSETTDITESTTETSVTETSVTDTTSRTETSAPETTSVTTTTTVTAAVTTAAPTTTVATTTTTITTTVETTTTTVTTAATAQTAMTTTIATRPQLTTAATTAATDASAPIT